MPVTHLIVKGTLGAGDDEMSLGEEYDIEESSETYSEEEEEGEEDEGESEDEEDDDWDEEWGGIESESEAEEGAPEPTSELPKCESILFLSFPGQADIYQQPDHMSPLTSEKRS